MDNPKEVTEIIDKRIDTVNTKERTYKLAGGIEATTSITDKCICVSWTDINGINRHVSINPTESGIDNEVLIMNELKVSFDGILKKPIGRRELSELYFVRDTIERVKRLMSDY